MSILSRLGWHPRPQAESDPNVAQAKAWYVAYRPCDANDYTAALDHARKMYEEAGQLDLQLDRKAEWTVALSGAAIAFVLNRFQSGPQIKLVIPALIALLAALALAVRARVPGSRSQPFSARDALERIDSKTPVAAWMTASYHGAHVALAALSRWRAATIRAAGVWLVTGVAAIGLPLAEVPLQSAVHWAAHIISSGAR